ncbi:MAG: hypothetical protein ACYC7A_11105 [Thermoanaerobaculia bacterium]
MALSRRTLFTLSLVALLLPAAAFAGGGYRITRSTGPFMIPADAQSVDWTVLNASSTTQEFRVSVYRLPIGAPKVLLGPGALTLTLEPGETTHNANRVGTIFLLGFPHEVVIESDSRDVLPMAISWSSHSGIGAIPSTLIPAADWVELQRP